MAILSSLGVPSGAFPGETAPLLFNQAQFQLTIHPVTFCQQESSGGNLNLLSVFLHGPLQV